MRPWENASKGSYESSPVRSQAFQKGMEREKEKEKERGVVPLPILVANQAVAVQAGEVVRAPLIRRDHTKVAKAEATLVKIKRNGTAVVTGNDDAKARLRPMRAASLS